MAHLCTINIGDLYRYLKEIHAKANDPDLVFEASFYVTGAQTHYAQAFLLRPDSGLAFNQLGNLYCDANGTLQSAYYLLYSVQSTNAYEGAYSNLRQLLDRKIVQFARLPASVEPKPIDTLVNSVLSLMYYFLYEHSHLPNYERVSMIVYFVRLVFILVSGECPINPVFKIIKYYVYSITALSGSTYKLQ